MATKLLMTFVANLLRIYKVVMKLVTYSLTVTNS
jgi:hypothetical protein